MRRRGLAGSLLAGIAKSLLATLVLALVLPISAGAISDQVAVQAPSSPQEAALASAVSRQRLDGVSALALDDEIPGVAQVSPYSSAIDLNTGDWLDVVRVAIPANTVFTADIAMSPGEWVAGALFPPGTGSVWGEEVPVDYSDIYSETSDRLSYYSAGGGTYYLVLFPPDEVEFGGDGYLNYTVTFQSNTLTGDYDVGSATALPASRADSLHWQTDVNDVYEVDLVEGQQLRVTMTPNASSDFDLLFYGPDSPSVWSGSRLAQYDLSTDSPDEITWLVPPGGDGTYNLEVYTSIYSGTYSMTSAISTPDVARVSGANRYLTSTAISKSTWTTSNVAVLATGNDPADALAASALAGVFDAPVILVPAYDKFSSLLSVYYELDRLGCSDVYVIGGDAAVDPWIDADLEDMGYSVERISGDTRYITAGRIVEQVLFYGGPSDTAFLVRGDDYADALAVSPYAFSQGIPVLLTKTASLSSVAAGVIEDENITNVIVAGGEAAVSGAVVAQVEALNGGATNVVRRAGSTRYATAKAVADYAVDNMGWASWDFMGAATGQSFPDALSGGAACGSRGGVLLLTKTDSLRDEVANSISDNDPDMVMIFGGTAAVSSGVATSIQNLMP